MLGPNITGIDCPYGIEPNYLSVFSGAFYRTSEQLMPTGLGHTRGTTTDGLAFKASNSNSLYEASKVQPSAIHIFIIIKT